MMNVFHPVRVKGKLVARNEATGSFAPVGLIRDVQLRNAEANGEVLVLNSANGRVTRVAKSNVGSAAPMKMSFLNVVEKRDPEVMFNNLERLTKMVGRGIQPSLVVTGMAGMGKTHIVKETLTDMGLIESKDFVHFKGRATAAGLFVTLYENSDKIIILDDCDSVFRDDDAVNILKGALDSYDTRKISYITSKPLKDEYGDPLPRHFEFTGRVIFISNISQSKLDDYKVERSYPKINITDPSKYGINPRDFGPVDEIDTASVGNMSYEKPLFTEEDELEEAVNLKDVVINDSRHSISFLF